MLPPCEFSSRLRPAPSRFVDPFRGHHTFPVPIQDLRPVCEDVSLDIFHHMLRLVSPSLEVAAQHFVEVVESLFSPHFPPIFPGRLFPSFLRVFFPEVSLADPLSESGLDMPLSGFALLVCPCFPPFGSWGVPRTGPLLLVLFYRAAQFVLRFPPAPCLFVTSPSS